MRGFKIDEKIKTRILLVIMLCFSFKTFCQNIADTNKREPVGTMKIYPLQLLTGELRVSFEKPLTNRVSVELGIGYLYKGYAGDVDGGLPITPMGFEDYFSPLFSVWGYDIIICLKGYISGSCSISGTYISPTFFYKYYSYHGYNDKYYMTGGQLLIGHKFSSKHKISFEVYSGLGFKSVKEDFSPVFSGLSQITSVTYFIVPTAYIGFNIDYSIMKRE